MKKLLICLLLFSSVLIVKGQDKIITIQHDTIECRILSVTSLHIHYEQKLEDDHVMGKLIPVEEVLLYYRTSSIVYRKARRKPARPWIIGVQAGGSSMLASTMNAEKQLIDMGISQSQAEEYTKQLKNGFHLNGEVYYKLTNSFGFGAKYSFFTSSAEMDFVISDNSFLYTFMGIREKQYIHYVGPSIIFQQWLDKNRKFQLSQMFSLGYVSYRGELRMDPTSFTWPIYTLGPGYQINYNELVEAKTGGATLGLSVEYYPLPYLSVGASAGLMYALPIEKVDYSNQYATETIKLPKQDYLKLSRWDYSLNIRIHF